MRFLLLFLLSALVLCSTQRTENDLESWKRVEGAFVDPETEIKLMLFLRHTNRGAIEQLFWEISNPESPQYAHYLSLKELAALVSPPKEQLAHLSSWLLRHGFRNFHLVPTGDVITVTHTLRAIEQIFQVKYQYYLHEVTERLVLRSASHPLIPDDIRDIVELTKGISDILPPTRRALRRALKKKSFKKPLGACASIIELAGGDGTVSVIFTASGNVGQQAQVVLRPAFSYPGGESVTGTGAVKCDSSSSPPVCRTTVPAKNYVPWTLTATVTVNGASCSLNSDYAVVASPMIVPQSLTALYNIPRSARITNASVTQSVAEFEQQYYSPSDLKLFFDEMGIINDTPVYVVGPNDPSNVGVEANLDIQWIMGIAPGSPTTFWSIKANSSTEIDDILTWAIQVGNTAVPPLVHSISYGMTETAVDKYLGPGYLARSDVEFQKLALRGLTVIIADGDTGAGDLGPPPMSQGVCQPLHADWPSQSPYVVAVGSTYVTPWSEPICYGSFVDCSSNPLGEVTVSVDLGMRWTTGGGFATTSRTPSFQADFVAEYLNKTKALPPSNYFDRTGRAYPDFVAVGHNLLTAVCGNFEPVDGTSASAPIFAGIITLLNGVRANANLKPLGYLNPLFYSIARKTPAAFTDVTYGINRCGSYGFDPVCCPYGFSATTKFDAVSGLGSLNYAVLANEVLKY